MISTLMKVAHRATVPAATLAMGALLLACADAQRPVTPIEPELTAAGIHPVVVIASQSASAATLELHLKRVDVREKVASYQGELTYDRAGLRLTSASIPAGITGAWNEVTPGTVRFTGIAVDGIESGAVLVMQFAATGPVSAGAVTLKMEEIVASEGFADLKGKVRQRGSSPALSRVRP